MATLNKGLFETKIKSWKSEINTYKDFVDEESLMRMCFEIRLYAEKIFKFLLTNLIKSTSNEFSDHKYSIEDARTVYMDLLDKYPYEQMGKLKNKLKKIETDIDIPESFIIKLNEFCHETGIVPKVNDVVLLINEFELLKDKIFSLI